MRSIQLMIGAIIVVVLSSCYGARELRRSAEEPEGSRSRTRLTVEVPMSRSHAGIERVIGVLTRSGAHAIKRVFAIERTSATSDFSDIPVGRWHLRVEAFDRSGVLQFSGEEDVEIVSGAEQQANLVLRPVLGTLAVRATWEDQSGSNRVLEFDGVSGYVEVPDSPSLTNIGTAITLEAWVKPGDDRFYNYLICKGFEELQYSMELNGSELHPAFHLLGLDMDYSGAREYWGRIVLGESMRVGVWTHLAMVYQIESGLTVYFDGSPVLHANSTGSLSHVVGDLRMGVLLNDTYQLFFKGGLDEVRIWNVARSANQIASNMRKELTGREDGLVGYWNFNETTTTVVVKDVSPYRNNGILRGGVSFGVNPPF